MLAYAASNPRPAARTASPSTLALVVAGHAAVLAFVLTARGEMPRDPVFDRTQVTFIDPLKPPPPPPEPNRPTRSTPSRIDRPDPLVWQPARPADPVDHGAATLDPGPTVGPNPLPIPNPPPLSIVRKAARLATSPAELRPPYPDSKRITGEQASLRLALQIGADGRVSAVEPVGAADPVFLAAARRHILRHWRYQPATEDGRAIASRTVITLRFELAE